MKKQILTLAYIAGRIAFAEGLAHDENPYPIGSHAHNEWSNGWWNKFQKIHAKNPQKEVA
jgi:hypothetical protein